MTTRESNPDVESTVALEETAAGEPADVDAVDVGAPLYRGQLVNRYVVVEELGAGNMGVVYRAYDPDLDRGIALKLMRVESSQAKRAAEIRTRLLREAQAIARVSHPNVVAVYDVGSVDAGVFVGMEFVDGVTLKRWVRTGNRSWPEILEVFVAAGRGLAAAHQAELVHRDFKPDNVMVGNDGAVKVLDFGLARAARGFSTEQPLDSQRLREVEPEPIPDHSPSGDLDASLTREGAIVGTPAYMAPEQHVGASTSPASDQFSFCVALWEAAYGDRPFAGQTRMALATAIAAGRIRAPPSSAQVPKRIQAILTRGLAKEATDRYPSMDALLEALLAHPGRRMRRVGFGLAVVGASAAAAYVASQGGRAPDGAELCKGASEKIARVWSPDREAKLSVVFADSGFAFGSQAWMRTAELIDKFAERWSNTRTDACRATRVHREQSEDLMDRRMACLDRRLSELDAVLTIFEEGERSTVVSSIDAVFGLGDLSECSDATSLVAVAPPPSSPRQREEHDALQTELVEIRALKHAGASRELLPRLSAIEERVIELAYPPLTENFWFIRGYAELNSGDTQTSRKSYEKAFREAMVGGNSRGGVWLAARLAFVVGHRLAEQEQGAFWVQMAYDLLRVNEDAAARASLWSAEASIALTQGDYALAIELDERLAEYWKDKENGASEHGLALGNLAVAQRQLGRYETSYRNAHRSVDVLTELYGEGHPQTVSALRRLAHASIYLERHDEALDMFERSLVIEKATNGPLTTEVALLLDGMGRTLRAMDRLDESEARHRDAMTIWEREYGSDHPDFAVSLMNIGYSLAAAKKDDAALEEFRRAAEIYEGAFGLDHPTRMYALNAIAGSLLRLERFAEARDALEPLISNPVGGTQDPTLVAESQFLFAQALAGASSATATIARARALADEARTAYETSPEAWTDALEAIETWKASLPDSAQP